MVSQPQGIYRWLSGRALWATSAALCAFCFVPLSLPYLFGTGSGATWDWGFLYVTLRFVALPLACAVYFVYAVLVAWRSKGASTLDRCVTAALAPLPLVVLITMYSWRNPLPPR